MVDTVNIPEVSDNFERKVALCIAIMAVALAVISTKGDNAKGDGLLAATKASSEWSYFQAKSIKEHSYSLQKELLAALPAQSVDQAKITKLLGTYDEKIAAYGKEKQEIMDGAKKLEAEVKANGDIDNRCDDAGLLLQIAIVLGSISILVHWRMLWGVSVVMGIAGTIVGVTALMM